MQRHCCDFRKKKQPKFKSYLAAIDATGFQSGYASRHYEYRKTEMSGDIYSYLRKGYPKATATADCESHLILSVHCSRGPNNDCAQLVPTLQALPPEVQINDLLGDMGYDSEKIHQHARLEKGIRTVIPTRRHRTKTGEPNGQYRRENFSRFKAGEEPCFGQRWQIETVFSMIKRRLGQILRGRSGWAHNRDIFLKTITFNLAIVANV